MTGAVVWFTGLPSAGKTTLAQSIHAALQADQRAACVLDSDVMREILGARFGYDAAGRTAFYTALAGIAAELSRQGLVVLVAATAHSRLYRDHARRIAPRFYEVWVATPLEECQARDDKRLYEQAAAGDGTMPGVHVAYEAPLAAEVIARGGRDVDAVERVLALLTARKPCCGGA